MQQKHDMTKRAATKATIPFYNDPKKRSLLFQIATLLMVGMLAYYLISNTLTNLENQSIASGFGFLQTESAFEIGESPILYSAADTYGRALVVGFLNTLIVSFIGIIITTILGTLIGIARLSSNWLVSRLAAVYIEVLQNIPVLLQLFFWYAFFYNVLPSPRQALNPIMGVFLSNRGLVFAIPAAHPAHKFMALALIVAGVVIYFLYVWARKRQERTGQPFPVLSVSMVL